MSRGGYGLLQHTPDRRDYRVARGVQGAYSGAFVDLSGGFPAQPWDQLALGSCVPHGTGAAVDYARAKAGLAPLNPPSFLFIYYQGRVRGGYPIDEDTGLQIRDGFTVISKDGAPPGTDWPYEVDRFALRPQAAAYDDAQLDQAVKYGAVGQGREVDDVIAAGYPVVFGFDVYSSFESDRTAATGVIPVPNTKTEANVGAHCMVICSTPKDGIEIPGAVTGRMYRKVRNSWGHDGTWGIPEQPGYCWFPVDYMDGPHASDFWQVTLMEDPLAPVPTPAPPPFPQSWLERFLRWLMELFGK